MSFHNWYSKSIERMHKIYEREKADEIAAQRSREAMDRWFTQAQIKEEKERLAKEHNEDEDLWGI